MSKDYVRTVLRTYAKRHFDNIAALSLWRMRYLDFYAPLSNKFNLAVILFDLTPDALVTLFELNADIQKLPNVNASAEVFDANNFFARYVRGFLPEVYIVRHGDFIEETDFCNELRGKDYKCDTEAIDETIDRAFISYGIALNELILGDFKSAIENIAYSLGYATIALYQHARRKVPDTLSDVIESMPENKKELIGTILDKIINLINRSDLPKHLEDLIEKDLYPCEKLQVMLQDYYSRELILWQYQLLGIVWREINDKMLSMELFIRKLLKSTEDLPYMQIELRGTKPVPVLRIKGPEVISLELA
ncbi:MAG: hypothetical protein QXY55_03740 [Candidatus Korarchaeota archaeon]